MLRDKTGKFYRDKSIPRNCFNCGLNKTYTRSDGTEEWHNENDNWYCRKCWDRLFIVPNTAGKQVRVGEKRLWLKFRPRKGICSLCGKKGKTHIHHFAGYDVSNPLKNTMEVCQSCHTKEGWKLGQFKNLWAKRRSRKPKGC